MMEDEVRSGQELSELEKKEKMRGGNVFYLTGPPDLQAASSKSGPYFSAIEFVSGSNPSQSRHPRSRRSASSPVVINVNDRASFSSNRRPQVRTSAVRLSSELGMNVGEDYEHVAVSPSAGTQSDRRHRADEPAACAQDIDRLAADLHCWREILVNGDRVLNWENPKLLGIIQLVFTLTFLFVWVIGPSLLTSIALIGLLVNAIDFAVPVLAPKYFDRATWTHLEEQHFRQICSRLGNIRHTAVDTVTWLRSLRHDRPTFYFTIMTVFYFVMAIVAERINGLLLAYLLLTVAFITPGMIRHSVLSHLRNQVMKVINDKMGKKTK